MKTSLTILAVTLLAVPPLRAQIVADGATNTLSNVTTNITGAVTVGTNGSFTLLVLSDNALLTNSGNGVIGRNATAKSNEVQLVSPTARWRMGGFLFVGSNGASSRLLVSNGAFVDNFNSGFLGNRPDSSNNFALVTGGGSLWSNRLDLTVGSQGRGNQLIVSNGGWVASRSGTVGNNASASNNFALVTGSGSVWSNTSTLIVGLLGSGNRLVIEAGGVAHCDNGRVGNSTSATDNEALVTGPGSLWTNFSFLTIGNTGGRNRLVVSNGAAVKSGTGAVGSFSNQVVVTGTGSVWSNQTFLFVGGASNRVEVSDGGWLACNDGSLGPGFGANNNTVVLTGSGSGWNNLGGLIVGQGGNGNVLIASNGATVLSSNATIGVDGSTANNNLALITGAGTLWSNRTDLTVGSFGVGNRLVVNNGATVVTSNLFVGLNASSTNNRVTVDGGTLRASRLELNNGSNILNAGVIEAVRLVVNSGGRLIFKGGTLAIGSSIMLGSSFEVGDGVSPATLHLTGNENHDFPSTLVVRPNATLMGNGFIQAPMNVQSGGTVSPGSAPGEIGRLDSFTGSSSLAGIINLEISKNGATLANDRVGIASTLTFVNATVLVTNIGPTALVAGDRFQLFTAVSFAGSIQTLSLPPLGPGLRWATNLLVDGSIEVESLAPSVTTLPASGLSQTAATLNGVANPKGTDTSAWFEFGFSTNYGNVTPPQALGSGNSEAPFSEALTGLIPGVAYHFRAVASNSFGVVFGADQSFPRFGQRDYLKASNTRAGDQFGPLAISGDTLVVGALSEDSNALDSGAAYVFVRNGDSWDQQAYLKASNTGQSDFFGASVGIAGDTIVIGARNEDSNATGVNGDQSNNSASFSGAAYVFVRNGTNWTQQAYLKASNTEANDFFGTSVAVSGDTVVVGAFGEDSNATGANGNQSSNSATNSGAAYVFVRSGTNWSQQAYLKASNTRSGNPNVLGSACSFGGAVAVLADTIVVGATGDASNATGVNGNQSDTSAFNSGAAYVFVRSGITWTQQAYLKPSNTGPFYSFGDSVAVSGETVVIGASGEESNATGVNGDQSNSSLINAGAAYVFVRGGTTWTQQAYLKASNTGASDVFGRSVAVVDDTVVVGAPGEDSNATGVGGDGTNNLASSSGAAYVFLRNGTTWSIQDYFKASNTESNDFFGVSVAITGDLVVVGAHGEDSNAIGINGDQNNNSASSSGAAYVFGPPLPPTPEINVSQSNTNIVNSGFGQAYLVAGTNTQSRSFTIKNTGNDFLTGLAITFGGPDAAMFSVTLNPVAPLTPTSNTTFAVRYTPTSSGTNTATLHIASNDADENPFNIQLSGLSLSFTEDRDGDGLNDASELLMTALGFNFQANQTGLVNTLFNNVGGAVPNLNAIGFFTQSQLQALNVDSPLLAKDPNTGLFTLTIGVEKANDLINFFPFPMAAPQTTINAEGKLEFRFSAPGNPAFFRLEAR